MTSYFHDSIIVEMLQEIGQRLQDEETGMNYDVYDPEAWSRFLEAFQTAGGLDSGHILPPVSKETYVEQFSENTGSGAACSIDSDSN